MGFKISWRGHHDLSVGTEPLGNQNRIRQRAGADCNVVALFLKIDVAVRQVDLNLDFRVGAHECAYRWSYDEAPEGGGGRDLQLTFGACRVFSNRGARTLKLIKYTFDIGQEGCTFLGDSDRTSRTVEEPYAKLAFQRLDSLGDGTWR